MPIRLNLLAEAQAEEELRRRDPVKRALWGGGAIIACVLVWSGVLFIKSLRAHSTLANLESQLEAQGGKYQKILDSEKKLDETNRKLAALQNLAGKRFLWGSTLNAIQQSALDEIHLIQLRGEQLYIATEETKPKTNDTGRVIIGRPGYITEKLALFFNAKDISANGDQINKFKQKLEEAPFPARASGTNASKFTVTLKNLSPPTFDPESGKTVVLFNLEGRFSEREIK